ncbi:27-O-demethylrifamycin SV methyltransferase [Algoriphagus sp. oki45]|uniref:methyltransferase domain-containing protein n=1 Tax=Algoriphagus sp. oki45 TaxID=3067294 RepID=UPI0027F9453B|nr:27-O-demethylrifamycin SV methyltransferase [Algoriphagus sp. oki45]
MQVNSLSAEINEAEIVRYYENCQVDYELLWKLDRIMCMHYGYWDESTTSLSHALLNMNKQLAEFGSLKKGQRVLDAGCGVGGSSFFIAKTYGSQTEGITLSDKQVEACKSNALKQGLQDSCNFSKQNYLSTEFPDNSFDVVWGMESVCYAWDKKDFLKEAYRVLKPGGTLVVADFFSNPLSPNSKEAELMKKWTDTWAIKAYAGIEEFWEKMEDTGFVQRQRKDVTPSVVKSIKRLYYMFFPGLVSTYLLQLLGLRNKTQTANTWSTYYQYKAYQKNLWRYYFFTATKPI